MFSLTFVQEAYAQRDYEETTYSNNKLSTNIYLTSNATATCGANTSIRGIVATTSERSDSGSVSNKDYYETLSGNISNLKPKKLRAGYGFSYQANASYNNEWNRSYAGGPSSATVSYPYVADGLNSRSQVLDVGSYSASSSLFVPKKVYVGKNSGYVFDKKSPNSTLYDGKEEVLDGGRKWYAPFEQKDGNYDFYVSTSPSGVNKMSLCLTDSVEIKGTALDDFVRRSVNADNAFPVQDPGWNWKGKENIISRLKEWFNYQN